MLTLLSLKVLAFGFEPTTFALLNLGAVISIFSKALAL